MAIGGSADAHTAADEALRVMAGNAYMTLATVDADGRPWATPVWFAALDRCAEFVWVSRPEARHSANIAARPAVAVVVFDSTVPVGEASAVYVEAEAEMVDPGDRAALAAALAVFNEHAQVQGIRSWSEHDVSGSAQFRMYRARASLVSVLDEHDGRVEVGW